MLTEQESLSNSNDDGQLGSDEEIVVLAMCKAVISTPQFFQPVEFQDHKFVDRTRGVIDQLPHLTRMPSLFRTLTSFTNVEWQELCTLVYPTINLHARSIGELRGSGGRPPKLDVAQRLLSCILYLKHANIVVFDSSDWNWSKSSLCDDVIFIASCVNVALENEIRWPSRVERRALGLQIPEFLNIGEDQFIMRRMGRTEVSNSSNPTVVTAFNKMHSGVQVEVEWGIGGVKNK